MKTLVIATILSMFLLVLPNSAQAKGQRLQKLSQKIKDRKLKLRPKPIAPALSPAKPAPKGKATQA